VSTPAEKRRLLGVVVGVIVLWHRDGQALADIPLVLGVQCVLVVLRVAGDEDLPSILGTHQEGAGLVALGEDAQSLAVQHILPADAGVAAPWLSRKTLKVVLNPPLLGFLAGIILVMLDWRLPMPIEASFRYLGGMTTPLAMLFIGIAISKASWSEIKFDRELTAAMVGRFVICPLCVMVCLPFFALPKLMSDVFVMQAAMPAMTNTSIVAKVYGGDYKYAAMLTVVSTLLAVITTPFYMWVLRG